MGKHNKARRSDRCGKIVVAAAAATVIGGWAAPVAYADEGAPPAKPSNPISKTADAVKSTVAGVQKAVTGAAGSFQKAAQDGLKVGSAVRAPCSVPNSNSPTSRVSANTFTGGPQSLAAAAPALPRPPFYTPSPPITNDNPTGSVTIPIADVTLPYLPDAPRFALPTPGAGLPPSFGSQGTNNVRPGPCSAAADQRQQPVRPQLLRHRRQQPVAPPITSARVCRASSPGTQHAAGNQVIMPTSFGTNFGWMGNDNGNVGINLPTAWTTC